MKKIVAIITPYKKNGKINWLGLTFLINFHIYNKTDKILMLGTTGESHIFNIRDFVNLILFIKKFYFKFLFSINKNNLKIIYYKYYLLKTNNINLVLLSLPYYVLPNKISIYNYFKKLKKFGIKTIFYNIPKRTGIYISFLLYNKLINKKYVFYIKNSFNNVKNSLILKNKKLFLLSGEDTNLYFCKKILYSGTISVYNNVFPKMFNNINNKFIYFVKQFNYDINPVLIKNLIKKIFSIKINFVLLFGIEKIFFTQSQI
ncbi:dihydrodipicolinate synthase family protein [Candidatus Carsonella ruddii]|uniref:dihydrodipicolinate synthase family protein n=1 Tax=Carsonella ruddii TaxID=114186 RepID=UPI003D81C1EE